MSYSLFFTDDARADIKEGYEWYEGQGEELGDEFLESLNATLKKVEEHLAGDLRYSFLSESGFLGIN
ncbi:hypothetical protein RCC89_10050 [Cytophagaceae bacterium ABcell3]|nr:hypothetical protein RCC89_10050 [Cytophagaceae bacterium ABcell3]